MELTHASFFSGVGGLDLGLERAGWRTVSVSEIDPYACAVLAERWPGVPNLGDIVQLAGRDGLGTTRCGECDAGQEPASGGAPADVGTGRYRPDGPQSDDIDEQDRRRPRWTDGPDWRSATLWSGGFPCQDLSVAGKRRGLAGERSGLAFAFLDLLRSANDAGRGPAAVLLENVPGLLSSHGGRDMAALLGAMADLGYGVAYRVLDARHFGVPQRRRRVFILGLRSGPDDPDGRAAAERAAAVLAVGTRCDRHPPSGVEAGEGAADGARDGAAELVGAIPAGQHGFPDGVQEFMQGHFRVVHPPPDPGGVRAAPGVSRRLEHRDGVAFSIVPEGGQGADLRAARAEVATAVTASEGAKQLDRGIRIVGGGRDVSDDPLLPPGLDSHRYRAMGNAVCVPVAEWLGYRLAEALR